MKKGKSILFIGNTYCSNIKELRSIFESNNRNNYIGKEGKPLRKELLAFFKDELLYSWLTEHSCGKIAKQLPTWKSSDDISDNELFKAIYKAIFEKECTANLESAFTDIAEFMYCEVDGNIIDMSDGKVELSEKADEIRFVYKALEEIDSKICFEIERTKGRKKHWSTNSKKSWYAKGDEIVISFKFQSIGNVNREGVYVWNFIPDSNHKEKLIEMEIIGNQRKITLNDEEQLTLYCFNNGEHDFWVTEPVPTKGGGRGKASNMLDKLNKKSNFYKFRFANREEIKTVFAQGSNIIYKDFFVYSKSSRKLYYPYFNRTWVRFLDKDSKPIDDVNNFDFVAVLNKSKD